jgi:heptaprenylglyceryl phosphate synthase
MRVKSGATSIELLTLAEVAQKAGVHPGAIRKRLLEGRSDAILIGGIWLFTESQTNALIRDMKPRRKKAAGPADNTGQPTLFKEAT